MLSDFGEDWVSASVRGGAFTFQVSQAQAIAWLVWFALIPLIGRLANRMNPERIGWPAAIGFQSASGAVFAIVHPAIAVILIALLLPPHPLPPVDYYRAVLDNNFVTFFVMYLSSVIAYLAFNYLDHSAESELETARARLRAARLERSVTNSRLDRLRKELRPHFLNNSLQSISGLVSAGDYERAGRMVSRLDHLLSASLAGAGAQFVALAKELNTVSTYLSIENVRFEDRMTVEVDVPRDLDSALIPSLVLQPLVENAVRHGVARSAKPVTVSIHAAADNDRLRIVVENNGVRANTEAQRRPGGIGLSHTAERLQLLYGGDARMDLAFPGGGLARATVDVPLRWADDEVRADDTD